MRETERDAKWRTDDTDASVELGARVGLETPGLDRRLYVYVCMTQTRHSHSTNKQAKQLTSICF